MADPMFNQPPSLPIDGLFDPMARLAVFAIFPLLVLAVLLSVLIMTGVLTLTPSSDNQWNTVTALLLVPAGVLTPVKIRLKYNHRMAE
jgi:hypothetical protein